MTKLIDWLKGKKTYFTVAVICVVAVCSYYGVEIPEWVWAVLGAMGLGFLRSGVTKSGQQPAN